MKTVVLVIVFNGGRTAKLRIITVLALTQVSLITNIEGTILALFYR